MIIVRLHHGTAARICRKGSRAWFKQQGWSWSDFLENGRPASDFEETGDPIAARAVAEAYREADNG